MKLTVEQALQQGIAAHKEGKLQDAERAYQAILQSQPKHPDANHNLALLAISVNQIEAALPLFKTALDVNPNVEQFWMSYIDALVKNSQVKDAKQAVEKAKKKGFDAKKLQALLSQSEGVIDNKAPSRELLSSLLEHYQNGRFNDAEKLAVSITQEFPNHQSAWKVLGAVLETTGRKSEAVNANQTSVALSPQDAEAHNNLGNTLKALGRLDEALASYKQAIALKPDYAQAHYNLGITLKALGRLDEALASYKQAIVLKPDYAEAHCNLGNMLRQLGKLEEAVASYEAAIALTTGFIVAHQNLAITLRELGKIEEATQSERFAKFLNSSNVEANESENFSDNLLFRQPSPLEYPALYRAGMGTENVGGFLRAMAQMLRPKNILEIGAGYTTPFLLEALINNERVYDDGNLEPSYFKDYVYDSKLVVIDNMSLGELSKKPGMNQIISSKYIEFVEGNFEGKADILVEKYGAFDFVWFDCGGSAEYKIFMDEYWDICSDYIFFHFTYSSGSPNELRDIILNNVTGNPSIFDIVEPHKSRQGSITMVRKT